MANTEQRRVLAGVISRGAPHCAQSYQPSVNTNVAHFFLWIMDATSKKPGGNAASSPDEMGFNGTSAVVGSRALAAMTLCAAAFLLMQKTK